MTGMLNRYATPVTVGLFAVSAVSGIFLFFHFAGGIFHEMHEWLSMVLLVPFGLHVWKNWAALMGYVRRGHLLSPIAASFLVAVVFAVPGMTGGARGGNPAFEAMQLVLRSSLKTLAPVLRTTPETLRARLQKAGYNVTSTDDTPSAISAKAGTPPERAWTVLTALGH